jgi:hypothetical protein
MAHLKIELTPEQFAEGIYFWMVLAVFAPLWGPPVVGGIWLGYFVHESWKWHPVFAIGSGLLATGAATLLSVLTFSVIEGCGRVTAISFASIYYGVQGWLLSTYFLGADEIWSVTIGILFALVGGIIEFNVQAKLNGKAVAPSDGSVLPTM